MLQTVIHDLPIFMLAVKLLASDTHTLNSMMQAIPMTLVHVTP